MDVSRAKITRVTIFENHSTALPIERLFQASAFTSLHPTDCLRDLCDLLCNGFFRARSRFCNRVLRMNLARGSSLFGALSQSKRERSECRAIISGACGAGWNRDQRDRFASGQVVKQGNTKKHLNRRSQRSQRITIVENHPNALRSSTADSKILRLSQGNTKKFLEQKITQSHHF
jgi:hypothetical protein